MRICVCMCVYTYTYVRVCMSMSLCACVCVLLQDYTASKAQTYSLPELFCCSDQLRFDGTGIISFNCKKKKKSIKLASSAAIVQLLFLKTRRGIIIMKARHSRAQGSLLQYFTSHLSLRRQTHTVIHKHSHTHTYTTHANTHTSTHTHMHTNI